MMPLHKQRQSRRRCPVEERLKERIIRGDRLGIERDLDEALERYSPLDIITDSFLKECASLGICSAAAKCSSHLCSKLLRR